MEDFLTLQELLLEIVPLWVHLAEKSQWPGGRQILTPSLLNVQIYITMNTNTFQCKDFLRM